MNCKNDECKVRMIKEGTHAKCPDNSSCGDYIPPTNADRIRAMSDEELAAFLTEVEYRRSAAGGGAKWKIVPNTLAWLHEPAEEDGHDGFNSCDIFCNGIEQPFKTRADDFCSYGEGKDGDGKWLN